LPQQTQRVLLVAYYFPPLGMSGTQRVAKWGRYFLKIHVNDDFLK
jgi:hypothetical protein